MARRPGRPRWSTIVLVVIFAGSVVAYLRVRPQPTPTGYIGHQRPVATLIPAPGTRSTTTATSTPPTTVPGPTTTVAPTPAHHPAPQPSATTTTVSAVGPTTTTSAPLESTTTVAPGASTSSTSPSG